MQVVPNVNKTMRTEDIFAGEVFKIRNDFFLKVVPFENSNCDTITCVGLADGIAYDFPGEIEAKVIFGNFVED